MKSPLCRALQCVKEDESGCWIWTGGLDRDGYGRISVHRRMRGAHQVVYKALRGEVPIGLELDHLCRNHPCVNPYHLEPVTHRENIRRTIRVPKTHCSQGHKYDAQNTRWYHAKKYCSKCGRIATAKYLRRKKAARQGTKV